jgi:V8-like Glu-specific endopeptidase
MTILSVIPETEQRFAAREQERQANLAHIERGDILAIAANTPELLAQRLQRLHAEPDQVDTITREGLKFDAIGPGQSSSSFPRGLERVLDSNDLLGLRFFEQGLRVARAVGRVWIRSEHGGDLGFGTGFLVSPRLLLTNHHVLPSAVEAGHSLVEFNYQENETGAIQASRLFALAPEQLFLSDAELDYSLVAVADDPDLASYGWLPLIADTGKLLVGETVNIIQHPNGEPKQLAIRNNQVVDELELFLHYQTDTDPGSSGSPVFNDQWEVVALHHSGVPKRNEAKEVMTTDGRVWEEWMGEQRIAWLANEGVRVSRLVRHIRTQPLAAAAEPLLQQLLEATPPSQAVGSTPAPERLQPPAAETEPPPSPPLPLSTPPQPVAAQPAAALLATWTIPLQVSVSLGSPLLAKAAPSPEQPAETAPLPAGGEAQEGLLLGKRPSRPPALAPAPPVTAADFRLSSLANGGFSWQTALSLGLASELAYSDSSVVQAQAQGWGFSDCKFLERKAAQGFLAWTADLMLVSFRGTESAADWISNLNVSTRTIPGIGPVHAGFLGQFQALQPELERLMRAWPSLPLLITGHSLGGGIAMVAAASWANSRTVLALYTYGQPAAAKGNAASAINTILSSRYHRFVNDADIVPRVPPLYQHAGHLLQFDDEGRVSSKEAQRAGVHGGGAFEASEASTAGAMLSEQEFQVLQQRLQSRAEGFAQEGSLDLISDHMVKEYLQRIRQQLG